MLAFFLLLVARDPLGPEFARDLTAAARAHCGGEFRLALGTRDPVGLVRSFTRGEEGKELYVQFLKDRYGYTIARVNEAYGTDVASFTELITMRFGGVAEDDAAFLAEMKSSWTAVVRAACKAGVSVRMEGENVVVRTAR